MSKNFADFECGNRNKADTDISQQEKINQIYQQYKNMDSSSLAEALASTVAKQKADGTFDYNLLSQSVEAVRAYLPGQTYQNLKNLLENLR